MSVIETIRDLDPVPAGTAIRVMEERDASRVISLCYNEFLRTYPNPELGITSADVSDYFISDTADWDEVDDLHTYVAVTEGEVVGCCSRGCRGDMQEILSLFVDAKKQERGIGSALLGWAIGELRPEYSIAVDVVAYNAKAIRVYERFGFLHADAEPYEPALLTRGREIPQIRMVRQPTIPGPVH